MIQSFNGSITCPMNNQLTTSTEDPLAKARRILSVLLPLSVLLAGLITALYYNDMRSERMAIETWEKGNVDIHAKTIAGDFKLVVADIRYLSEAKKLKRMLETGSAEHKRELEEEYVRFSNSKGVYDQIRFLDEKGMEVIRINYNDGSPHLVPVEELQFKGNRYYFQETFRLQRPEVFVSPFDLNVEQGEIEQPHKPIIRFSAPVFDTNGEKRGVLIINYLGANMIEDFRKSFASSLGQAMLLQTEGYWLVGPSPEYEWGFMFAEENGRSFKKEFPIAWQQILNEKTGQFQNANGLFTFATVYPLAEALGGDKEAVKGLQAHAAQTQKNRYYWKIVSHIDPEVLQPRFHKVVWKLGLIYLVVVSLIGLSLWLMGQPAIRSSSLATRQLSPSYLLAILSLTVFLAEILVMFILDAFPPLPPLFDALIDSTLLMVFISPALYFFLFRPLIAHISERRQAESALKEAKDSLESEVEKRTWELKKAVDDLSKEIVERKQTEKALKLSKEQYKSLVDNVNLGITLVDTNYKVVMANRFHSELMNKSVQEYIGKECFMEFEKRKEVCSHCPGRKAMVSRKLEEADTEAVLDDGNRVSVHIKAFPVTGSDGVITGFIEVVEDVTSQKKDQETRTRLMEEIKIAKEELEESNLKLKKKVSELEKFQTVTMGREEKIIQLKKKVRELERRLDE